MADASGASDRYLGNLEGGASNLSLVIVDASAGAQDVPAAGWWPTTTIMAASGHIVADGALYGRLLETAHSIWLEARPRTVRVA